MGSYEFAEWQCFYANEQLHPAIARVRHAQQLAAIYTGQASPPPGEQGHKASHFLGPDPWASVLEAAAARPATNEEIFAQVELINSMFPGGAR